MRLIISESFSKEQSSLYRVYDDSGPLHLGLIGICHLPSLFPRNNPVYTVLMTSVVFYQRPCMPCRCAYRHTRRCNMAVVHKCFFGCPRGPDCRTLPVVRARNTRGHPHHKHSVPCINPSFRLRHTHTHPHPHPHTRTHTQSSSYSRGRGSHKARLANTMCHTHTHTSAHTHT